MKTRLALVILGALGVLEPLVDLGILEILEPLVNLGILVVLVVLGLRPVILRTLEALELLVDLGAPAPLVVLEAPEVQVVHSVLSGKIPASNFVPAFGTP